MVLGLVAIVLGFVFENQNVAFMVGLAFAIAASCNFPVLLMSMLWKGLTTTGAVCGGLLGLISAVVLVVLGQAVWVDTLHNAAASSPTTTRRCSRCRSPSCGIWRCRRWTAAAARRLEQAAFDAQFVRSETGIGSADAHAH